MIPSERALENSRARSEGIAYCRDGRSVFCSVTSRGHNARNEAGSHSGNGIDPLAYVTAISRTTCSPCGETAPLCAEDRLL